MPMMQKAGPKTRFASLSRVMKTRFYQITGKDDILLNIKSRAGVLNATGMSQFEKNLSISWAI